MSATVDAMREQAHAVLAEILKELAAAAYVPWPESDPYAETDPEAIELAISAIELRVFPLVVYGTALETNALFAQQVSELYQAIQDEAAGYMPPEPEPDHEQLVLPDELVPQPKLVDGAVDPEAVFHETEGD